MTERVKEITNNSGVMLNVMRVLPRDAFPEGLRAGTETPLQALWTPSTPHGCASPILADGLLLDQALTATVPREEKFGPFLTLTAFPGFAA